MAEAATRPDPIATPPVFDLKAWEKGLIALAIALFLGSFYLYVSNYPLKQLIFGLQDEGVMQVVGSISELKGSLRRQSSGQAEFKGVAKLVPLYDQDTIVTGPDSTATIRLDDGSTIELGPSAMIKLRFETGLGLGGISRAANIEVVAGKVTGESQKTKIVLKSRDSTVDTRDGRKSIEIKRAPVAPVVAKRVPVATPVAVAKPTPPPIIPIAVAPITPRPGAVLSVPVNAVRAELSVDFYWGVLPVASPTRFTLWRVRDGARAGRGGKIARDKIAQLAVKTATEQAALRQVIRAPGLYEWEVESGDSQRPTRDGVQKAAFRVNPTFEGIRVLDPLVGGQKSADNRIREKRLENFGISLNWQAYPLVASYRVQVKKELKDATLLLDRKVVEPMLGFSQDKMFQGKFHYQISGVTQSGFQVYSAWKEFTYKYLAPTPVQPANLSVFTPAMIAREGHSVLITWQKTNFTDSYELELSQDPAFTKIVTKEKLRDNFYVYRSPPPGKYWWRVRGSSGATRSADSTPLQFTVEK